MASDAAIDVLKPGANDSTKQALVAAATADADGFKHLADLAVNPLKTRADVEAAVNSIRDFVTGKTMTAAEKAALTGRLLRQKKEEYELLKAEFDLLQKGQFQVCLRPRSKPC